MVGIRPSCALGVLAMSWCACVLAVVVCYDEPTCTVTTYELTMTLKVPRVYDNLSSLGYRAYQSQKFVGTLVVAVSNDAAYASVTGLRNKTHKVGGLPVSYETYVDENPVWTFIGNNKKDVFRKASVAFSFEANPSYNIGADEPDNTLVLALAGAGTEKAISGYAAGQIGCGCQVYGHVSPTRLMWTDTVKDIAGVHGTWKAKLIRKKTVR